MCARKTTSTADEYPRILVLNVWTPDIKQKPQFYFQEFQELIKTAGIRAAHTEQIKLRAISGPFFFTKGKLQEVAHLCEKHNIEEVVISSLLNPVQERNLESMLNCTVFGRTELIIEIFRQAAHSGEGKIQVEMAYLEHMKTRLAGHGRDMAQQAGFIGGKGAGETQKELLRRFYVDKIRQARKQLLQLRKTRNTQRKQRLSSGKPLICLVGYTNAGKSSTLNVLTKSNILAEDKLFATLDTTTRELFLPDYGIALISDTVGFINQLPPQLVEAFQSTLDEVRYAHLLLHVIDSSNPDWKSQIDVVNETLEELEAPAPVIHVFNKMDLLSEQEREEFREQTRHIKPAVYVHTKHKDGVQALVEAVELHLLSRQNSESEAK